MPKFLLSAPFSRFHGKIGHLVPDQGIVAYSTEKAGNVARAYTVPLDPFTSPQSIMRTLMTTASQSWADLVPSDVDAWNTASLCFRRSDILHQQYRLSGFSLFISCSMLANLYHYPYSSFLAPDPPSYRSLPPLPAVASLNSVSLSSSLTPGYDDLVLSGSFSFYFSGFGLLSFWKQPHPGRFPRENEYRLPDMVSPSSPQRCVFPDLFSLKPDFFTDEPCRVPEGSVSVGDVLFFRITAYSSAQSLPGVPQYFGPYEVQSPP